MKFTKTLASVAAAALAVSSLAVSAFAADALVSMTVNENGGPKDAGQVNLWELTFDDSVYAWAGKVDKAVATVTTEAYANGALGGNTVAADGWAASAQQENSAAGTNEWVWDSIGGLKAGKGDDGKETGYFKVEVWWMNAQGEEGNQTPATLTIDKVDFYDKAGDLLATYPVADETPADTDTKPAEPKPVQTKAEIAAVNSKEPSFIYTVKGDIDTLKVDVAVSPNEEDKSFEWNDWCGAGVVVKNPDGTTKYYQWGGAQVSWGWDATGDKEFDSFDGVNGKTWVGTVSGEDRSGQLSIPVVKGSVVEFYCLSWVDDTTGEAKYEKTQYTLTINDVEVVAANDNKTPDDDTKNDDTKNDDTKNDDTNKEDPVKPGECSGVVIGDCSGKKPEEPPVVGPTEDPTEPGKSDTKPANDNKKPANPNAGVTVAVVPAAVAAAAVAAAGIVLKKRSK